VKMTLPSIFESYAAACFSAMRKPTGSSPRCNIDEVIGQSFEMVGSSRDAYDRQF